MFSCDCENNKDQRKCAYYKPLGNLIKQCVYYEIQSFFKICNSKVARVNKMILELKELGITGEIK